MVMIKEGKTTYKHSKEHHYEWSITTETSQVAKVMNASDA